ANEHLATPMASRTAWLTSRRVVASTTHAAYRLGSRFDATTMVLAARAAGYPYCAQNAAVSAYAGSQGRSSNGTPSASTAATVARSVASSSVERVVMRRLPSASGCHRTAEARVPDRERSPQDGDPVPAGPSGPPQHAGAMTARVRGHPAAAGCAEGPRSPTAFGTRTYSSPSCFI